MPPLNSITLVDQLIRTNVLTPKDDGSIQISGNVDPRLAGHFQRVGLTNRLFDVMGRPGREWARNTILQNGGQQRNLNPREIEMAEVVRHRIASRLIERFWTENGGAKSNVGLPVGHAITVAPAPQGAYVAHFRSGSLQWTPGGPVKEDVEWWVQIRFVGLECVIRQEASDEIYGVISCMVPALSHVKNHIFPGGNNTISMGREGERLWLTDVTLYKGPIADVKLWCGLVENDTGDVEEISQDVANRVSREAATLLGGMTGLPAEAIANQSWYMDGIGQIAGFVLDEVFGIGDDPYMFTPLVLHHDQVALFAPPVSVTRPDDANVIAATTHSIVVEGIDDGGDRGLYKAYFLVRRVSPVLEEDHDWR